MKNNKKFDASTLRRLFAYMKEYRGTLITVVICIIFSAVASAASSLFLQTLIDDYITPMLKETNPVFTGLIRVLCIMAVIYLVGAASTWIYNRRMVTVAQGTLKKIRDEMFGKMQHLPVGYFDAHTHGDIMSLYTNDTDTLRQLIAQSMSQLVSSACTIVAVFFSMLYLSIWLTILVVISLFFILQLVKRIAGKSAGWFVKQQETLGDLDGYVEEMVMARR